jgi:kynureninase
MENLLDLARKLDREDELRKFRGEFFIPEHRGGTAQLYFCGHSLGLQPKAAAAVVEQELQAWRELAVRGHFEGRLPWTEYNERLCTPLGELAGAGPREVAVMNTLTVNLHLLMVSFYRPRGIRRKILIEQQAFPSDRYAAASQIRFHGLNPEECLVELEPEPGERLTEEGQIENYLEKHGREIALVLWPGVQYASGQAFDLERIASAAKAAGAHVGFDLAHSIGNLPLALHESGSDFASWCHYKYLNAGPGAIGGVFVNGRHHGRADLPRLNGWWGNKRESRFDMAPEFTPGAGANAWQLSNPPILSMAPLVTSLDIFHAAGMGRLRKKSRDLTAFLAEGIGNDLGRVLEIITPSDPERRGCQLSLRVLDGRPEGRRLFRYLEEHGAVTDWREPDIIRVAPVPLYNSFADCARLLQHMRAWAVQA